MFALTVKFSPLKLNVDPSLICLHSPHLDSLHLVTSNFFCCLSENFALVNNFFRFGGCRLLFKNIFLFINGLHSVVSKQDRFVLSNLGGIFLGYSG